MAGNEHGARDELKKEAEKTTSSKEHELGQTEGPPPDAGPAAENAPAPTTRPMSLMERLLLWLQNRSPWVGNGILVVFVIYLLLTSSVTVVNALQELFNLLPKETPFAKGVIVNQTNRPVDLFKVGDFIAPGPFVPPEGRDLVGCFDLYKSQSVPLDANCITVPAKGKACLWVKIRDTTEAYEQYRRGERSLMLKFKTPSGRRYITHINTFSKHGLDQGWELRIKDEFYVRRSPVIVLCLEALKNPNFDGYGSRLTDEMPSFMSDLALGIQDKSDFGPYHPVDYEKIVSSDDPDKIPAEVWVGVYGVKNGAKWILVRVVDARGKILPDRQLTSLPYTPLYTPEHKDDLIKMILQDVREKIITAYPIKGKVLDVFGKNGVRLSVGALAGVYKDMELYVCTSAGRWIEGGTVKVTHTWPTISLGTLDPKIRWTYGDSDDAIRSLLVRSSKD